MAWKREIMFIGVLVGLSCALWVKRLHGPIDLRYDAGVYYVLGTSIDEGTGYRLINEPGNIRAVQYPPLLPLVIAAHERVLGSHDPMVVGKALRHTYMVLFTLYLLATYWMARRFLNRWFSFAVAAITGLFFHAFFLSDLAFAEVPYALTTILFCIAATGARTAGKEAAAGATAVAAYLFRAMGIALLAAWVGDALLRKQWRTAAIRAVVALAPIVAWQGYIHVVTHSAEYAQTAYAYQRADYMFYNVPYSENVRLIDPFAPEMGHVGGKAMLKRVIKSVVRFPLGLGEAVSMPANFWEWPLPERAVPYFAKLPAAAQSAIRTGVLAFPIFIGVFVIIGLFMWLWRRQWILLLYVAGAMTLVAVTPWPGQFCRYMMPVTPFLAVALMEGVRGVRQRCIAAGKAVRERVVPAENGGARRQFTIARLRRHYGWIGTATMGCVLGLVFAAQGFCVAMAFLYGLNNVYATDRFGHTIKYRLFYDNETWTAFGDTIAWLKTHAKPDDIVGTCAPHDVWIATGLKAVMIPMESDVNSEQRMLDSVPVTYLIIDELTFVDTTKRYTRPLAEQHPEWWGEPVFTSVRAGAKAQIYRRVAAQ